MQPKNNISYLEPASKKLVKSNFGTLWMWVIGPFSVIEDDSVKNSPWELQNEVIVALENTAIDYIHMIWR